MAKLAPCPRCGAHLVSEECPWCGVRPASGTKPSAVAALLGLSFASSFAQACAIYGATVIDTDHDGYGDPYDCNDRDPAIHPGATETLGDDVDSDCDGRDNPVDDSGAS